MKPTAGDPPKQSRSGEEWSGKVIADRYSIVRPLGRGGMGSVHLAEDLLLDKQEIAIKILHSDLLEDAVQKQRFLREMELIRRVNHKNVVRLFDIGVTERLVFYVMEYLSGPSLEEIILNRSLPFDQVSNLIIQICEGLSAIHASQIIHRDLKPANIFIQDDGSVKITDFGIARVEDSQLTKHNEIIGSVLYISPENWIGRELTLSIDLYSLGIILYEVCVGHPPFQADTAAKLMRLHLDGLAIPPRELNPSVPPWLNKLILRLLEKSPLDRPRSAAEVAEEVRTRSSPSSAAAGDVSFEDTSAAFLQSLEAQWERSQKPSVMEKRAAPAQREAPQKSASKNGPGLLRQFRDRLKGR